MADRPSIPTADVLPELSGGKYRISRRLGGGGMGEVFEAEHISLGKKVVVKTIRVDLAGHADLVERLTTEARAAASLHHPNICEVFDVGQTSDGRPFLVMEKLEGRTLADEVRTRGELPVLEALDLIESVLAALGAAHKRGIVHRDIKPPNIFLVGAGLTRLLKVLDFGIAKIIEAKDGEVSLAPPALMTKDGAFLGSPSYCSPEQVRSVPLDGRADLYAAGCLLYKMLTGSAPFDHLLTMEKAILAHALERPAAPSSRATQPIPGGVDRLVLKALEKKPEDRFQSAEAFVEAIRGLRLEIGGDPAPLEKVETEDTTLRRAGSLAHVVKTEEILAPLPKTEEMAREALDAIVKAPPKSATRPAGPLAAAPPPSARARPFLPWAVVLVVALLLLAVGFGFALRGWVTP